MPDQKNQLVAGFILIGIALIGLSVYFSTRSKTVIPSEVRLAKVEKESGKVSILRNGYTQRENVEIRAYANNLDSIETSDLGEALLQFDSSYKIRVLDNSLVTLEKVDDPEDFHIVLIIKRGDIKVEGFGREEALFVAKNGERVSATDYNGSSLNQMPTVAPTPVESFATTDSAAKGLSEEEITSVMNSNKTAFFKCYTQLLQKDPGAKGQVTLSFSIENNGKLSSSEVASSTIGDLDFKNCLISILQRVEFKTFSGPAISTLFPLKFE